MPAKTTLIHDPLRWRAAFTPNKPAIITTDSSITYQELDRRTNRLANALIHLGVKADDRVALLSQNSVEFLEAIFGISKAGGVSVPLGYRFTSRELHTILGHSGATIAIVEREYVDVLTEA